MVTRSFLIFFFLYSVNIFSQNSKDYQFDYVLEYATEYNEAGIIYKSSHYRFINSKDNSFMLIVTESMDKVTMQMFFNNGIYYFATIPHDDFFVEAISIRCPTTFHTDRSKNSNYKNYKDFTFTSKTDTVINAQSFHHFVLNAENKKKAKKQEIFTEHYILDNSLNLLSPALPPYDPAYKFWQDKENVPQGILKERYITDGSGKKTERTWLVQAVPLRKIIIIDKTCK